MRLQEAFIETPWLLGTQLSADAASPDDRSTGSESARADRYGPSVAVYDLAVLARSECP